MTCFFQECLYEAKVSRLTIVKRGDDSGAEPARPTGNLSVVFVGEMAGFRKVANHARTNVQTINDNIKYG